MKKLRIVLFFAFFVSVLQVKATFEIKNNPYISSIYDSQGEPSEPESVSYDLSTFIRSYPAGVTKLSTTFTINTDGLDNGTIVDLMAPGSPLIEFIPNDSYDSKASGFTVTVSATANGTSYSETFSVRTFVYDRSSYQHPNPLPPGYVTPEDFPDTQYGFMGAVEFTSAYRFITHNNSTSNANRMAGFTIPLVADLDGDGYPEIIGLSVPNAHGAELTGRYNGIQIYNGQTGELISKLTWPTGVAGTYTHSEYHGSPSPMAIVDSDRNGEKELIMCFPSAGGASAYLSKIMSFLLVPQKNQNTGVTTGYEIKLNPKWPSTGSQYNTGATSYHKPLPTVVDIDGDSIPEVVVYNKIYNAVNGDLLLTLESLGSTAYIGYDRNAYGNDGYIGFNYVYDVDLDGIYDVVAGGKVYKIGKNGNTFSYSTITMSGVPDGRTGVADINGDGIPDVVVVTRSGVTTPASNIRMVVWNPGFFKMDSYTPNGQPIRDSSGNLIKNDTPNPYIMADLTFGLGRDGGSGSNSYVYIGDIDGRVQEVNGKKYRLPEIAIMARRYDYKVAKHPNILNETDSPIGTSGSSTSSHWGDIVAFTWDADPVVTTTANKLKISFILEHNDTSNNTGFTMFDFDNDGMMEICYRDEKTLRIIKAKVPYVDINFVDKGSSTVRYNRPDVILFRENVSSFTGFEYPVIADIDNDASAEMVVMGHLASMGSTQTRGYIYALGYGDGDKFAPALPVWNQFMYDPFKINEDLTTPIGPAPNRLDYSYTRVINDGEKVIEFNPYNATIMQATKYTLVENEAYGRVYDPIVFLTDAYILDHNDPEMNNRPILEGSDGNVTISFTIGNKATALTDVSTVTPVAVYRNGKVSEENYIKTYMLSELYVGNTTTFVNEPVQAGKEMRVSIKLTGQQAKADDAYIIRLGDDSEYDEQGIWEWRFGLNSAIDGQSNPNLGIGVASRAYRDCDWSDQSVKAAKMNIFPDAATIQAYGSVEIPVFDNDILPDSFFDTFTWNMDDITKQPLGGSIQIIGTGRDTKIKYLNERTDLLTHAVDSFCYKAEFIDPSISDTQMQEKHTTVYIYILQSHTGLLTCSEEHTVVLKELPKDNVTFYWFQDDILVETGVTKVIEDMRADSIYMVEPRISPSFSAANFRGVSFPQGKVTIQKGDESFAAMLKWTGRISTEWSDPGNWVEIKNGTEMAVNYIPASCMDVIIPGGTPYYPELIYPAACGHIKMENRAMIAGIHHLSYSSAEVELTLASTERERFVMWSAPMKEVYTGDYHFDVNAAGQPVWDGDVYMNFFQSDNPDNNNSAIESAFTATFGHVGVELSVKQAFNIKVENRNTDKTFTFPKSFSSYTGEDGEPREVIRSEKSNRFILDKADLDENGEIDMEVNGDNNFAMIQVVNPFMAYLDVARFLEANEEYLERGYKIWDGKTGNGFVSVVVAGDNSGEDSYRYYIEVPDPENWETVGYIPPLQSFLVMKNGSAQANGVETLKMSSAWTTTLPELNSSYTLRSSTAIAEQYLLRIKATTADGTNSTLLYYDDMAVSGYKGNEDFRKLFNPESTLELYSFASTGEPLAFHASGEYDTYDVRLGVRMNKAQPLTLEFSGMEGFCHDIILIDHDNEEQIYDLSLQNSFTFNIDEYSTGTGIDLPNRFSLSFAYTGYPVSNETVTRNDLTVVSKNGHLHISAGGMEIENLQVYNLQGQRIFHTQKTNKQFKVPVERDQLYIVKAQVNHILTVVKTISK